MTGKVAGKVAGNAAGNAAGSGRRERRLCACAVAGCSPRGAALYCLLDYLARQFVHWKMRRERRRLPEITKVIRVRRPFLIQGGKHTHSDHHGVKVRVHRQFCLR
jgi:hypothetical protein